MAIFEFIEGWYNAHRRHSALGYLSPCEFESTWAAPHFFGTEEKGKTREESQSMLTGMVPESAHLSTEAG